MLQAAIFTLSKSATGHPRLSQAGMTGIDPQAPGTGRSAFPVAGTLLLVGASAALLFTRDPIAPEQEATGTELAYEAAQ